MIKATAMVKLLHSTKISTILFVLSLFISANVLAQTKSTLTTAGTTSFSAPTGVTSVTVQAWGSGGAGGGSNANKSPGSGGGGGAYNSSNTVTVTPGTTYTNSVIVGAGGTGAIGTQGGNGNNSSVAFGSSLSANGGKGGAANAINTAPIGDGGAAGAFAGGRGGSATQGVNGPGGGGASSAGTAAAGNNGTAAVPGAAVTGGGAGGAAGAQSINGTAGSTPGGGGGGGGDKAGATNTAGGNGAAGQVIISYFLLTGTSNVTVCNGTTANMTVSGTTTNLPVGTYTVIYDLGSPNASTNNSTTMTVASAGTGTFTTVSLSTVGSTSITITSITATLGGITYRTSYDATGNANNKATITVSANNTAGAASSTPTLCINTALTAITHTTSGATGIGTATGLPTGVTAAWASNTITISGTPTASGTFNYTVPLTGGCGSVNATGTITVTPANTAGAASSTPTLCINTALTAITHTTTGATGIGTATGLPTGVTAAWASNTITISGTPTASGTFNYTIPLTGGCGSVNATGTITVLVNTVGAASSTPTLCINTALTAITHSTTGATGIGTATGLPTGVTAAWAANTITISGTPTTSGTFNYNIPLTGGCGSVNATGTITVTPANTVGAASSTPTLCINTVLTAITHTTTGATGIGTATGLPTGVTAAWAANTITITGTPTASGTFNYSISLTGGCGSVNATGTITVNGASTAAVVSGSASICLGSSTNLQVAITGGTPPYTVVYTTGSVSSYVSGTNIPVSPASTTNYTITSVTDANGCVGTGNSGTATVTLTTTTSTDGGASWDNGTPTNTTAVVFDGSTGTISSGLSGCTLTLTNNASVTVASASDVTLSGALTVNSGSTFTLNNNANLIQGGTTNTNSGNIVVKRNSSALKRLDYTLWSSPVTGQGLYAFSPFTFGNRFYVYRTNTNIYNNADVGFSLTGLNPDGVNGNDSNNVQFEPAKGYLIRMPWDHPTTATTWNGTFTGVPNNGNYSYTLVDGGAGNRFNLVGNPYPSPIDATAFIGNANNSSSITGALYFWRKTNNALSPSYCTWTLGGFVSNGEAQVFDPNDVIQVGQGFFVEGNGNGTVSFDNTMRIGDNANQFFKNSNTLLTVERSRIWLNATNTSGQFSQAMVGYFTNATQGVDAGIDGKYINDGDIALTSLISSVPYAIQGRAPFNAADIVPLSFKVTTAGSYTITIDHVDGLFTDGTQAIYLKDNLDSSEHNLQTGAYTFASDAGTFNNRFEITYQSLLANPTFTPNSVVIYSQNNGFVINSGNTIMASVKVFDIRGRLLQERIGVNASQTSINGGLSNEVLLVQITSEDGVVVTKKVIR
jgi:hypothetical protein